jgi:hypothetical protein
MVDHATVSRPSHICSRQTRSNCSAPQGPSQPDVSETAGSLNTDAVEPHLNLGCCRSVILEKLVLVGAAGDVPCQCLRAGSPLRVQLTQLRDRLLTYLAPTTNRAYQAPVRVRLAILTDRRVPQVHASSSPTQQIARCARPAQAGRLALHASFVSKLGTAIRLHGRRCAKTSTKGPPTTAVLSHVRTQSPELHPPATPTAEVGLANVPEPLQRACEFERRGELGLVDPVLLTHVTNPVHLVEPVR